MSCPSCGHENPTGARFCNECGASLAAPAPARDPRSYTPRHLVEKILAQKSALEGERKPVTVLFADVVRSMELAERIDPEDWHRLLDRLFRILADGVHRYEGTINQYTGDGIMALFGAPIAHEDHAERACAAALEMLRRLRELGEDVRRESGLDFAVRMGLNSGEVVVGRIGDDLRMDYTAQGHVVGLAARVQQLAPPGGASVTGQTARLASGFFDFLDRGEHTLKGATAPVQVFDLRGPGPIRTRFDRSRARGLSRFVGRDRELALLGERLSEAKGGRPQIILITAEPGAGKSRLCHELVERSRGVALHYARALSHGRMLPFHTIVELARGLFGIGPDASAATVRGGVERGLALARSADPAALTFWLELFGAPDPAVAPSELELEARRARLFQSLGDVVERCARQEPALLWIEDLHWLDAASEAALEALTTRLLAPESAGARVMLIATTRPGYRPAWLARVERLSLPPLADRDSSALLDDWLGPDPALAPLRARLEGRARGNPLFVEEIVRSLVERGALHGERGAYAPAAPVDEIALPDTVQAVLASRIDRLSPRDKDVLQVAAVVGPDVPGDLLRAVAGLPEPELAASLERLAAAELLGPAEHPGEQSFRHPLAQEVAYRTQLLDRRRRIHADVARALLAIHGSAASAHAALLAHHFEEAGEFLEAARWHEHAGRRVARNAPADGARHCRSVARLLADLPESRETLTLELTSRIALLEIGRLAGTEESESRQLFEEAHAVAERLGDPRGHAFLLTSYGRLCGLAGDVAQYLTCAERAAGLADASEDGTLAFEMRAVLAHALLAAGRLRSARTVAESALAEVAQLASLREALGRSTAPSLCRVWWALASAYLGETAEAQSALEALLADEEKEGLEGLYGTRGFLCEVLRLRGDLAAALAEGRRAVELAEERGSPFSRVEAAAFLGTAAVAAGDVAAARSALEPALALARTRRTALWYEPRILATLAEASLAGGDRPAARALLTEARGLVERGRGWRLSACDVELALVHLLGSEPGPDRAAVERGLASVDALAVELGAEPYRRAVEIERAHLERNAR
ncbi:MAG TPA: adenylate/guanylate cyclase domain-containing protein [Candidatus Methylomirabilis sp.]|nr:adenylate/guanylate cyclase domain-containing protein [Candidatus Methylomirabilis sp.]